MEGNIPPQESDEQKKRDLIGTTLNIRKLTEKDFGGVFPIGFQFYKEHFYARMYSLEKLLKYDPEHGCYVATLEIDGQVRVNQRIKFIH